MLGSHSPDPTQPYFGLAYGVMMVINLVFVVAIVLVSLRLFQLSMAAVTAYWILARDWFCGSLVNGGPGLSPGVGMKPAASGIGK